MKLGRLHVLASSFACSLFAVCGNGAVVENTWNAGISEGEWEDSANWTKEVPSESDTAAGFYGNSNHSELDVTVRLPDRTNFINRIHVLHRYPSSFVFDGRNRNFSMGALNEDDLNVRGSQNTATQVGVAGGSFYPLNIMSELASDSTVLKINKASGDGRAAVFDWRDAYMRTFSPFPKDVSVEFLSGIFDFNVDNSRNWNLEFASSGLEHSRMLISNSTVKCAVFNASFYATNSTLVIDKDGTLLANGNMQFGHGNTIQYPGTNTVIVKNGGQMVFENGGEFLNSFMLSVGSESALCRRQEFYLSGAGSRMNFGQMAQAYFLGNTLVDVSGGASLVLPGIAALSNHAISGFRSEVSELRLSGDESRIFVSTNIVAGKKHDAGFLSLGTVHYVSNRVVVSGGQILPFHPDGTGAIAMRLSTATGADSVFELHGGNVEFWVTNAVNRDTSCYVRLGPGDSLFSVSGGRMKCGDFYVGAGMPSDETTENEISHVHELRMTGGEVDCNRLYLGSAVSSGKDMSYWHSDARVVLDGGVLCTKQAFLNHPSNCVGRLWANGGTIRAKQNADLISAFTSAELGPKGLTVDTAGLNDVSVSQSFSDKPGEKGTLRFAGGGIVAFAPAFFHSASTTLVAQATTLCMKTNTVFASTLVVDGGTFSLVGVPSQVTLDGFAGRGGKLLVDPGDKVCLKTSQLEIDDFTLKFNSTPAADSAYDVFVFDGDVAGNAELRSAIRKLKVENLPSGQYGSFAPVYDAETRTTTLRMTCTKPLSAYLGEETQTVWKGPAWDADGWPAGMPDKGKVAVFSGGDYLQVTVPGLQEVGAVKFSGYSHVLSGEGACLEFSGIRGGAFIEVLGGEQRIEVPTAFWHTVPVSVAEGAAIVFAGPMSDGGFAKTGKGRLELLADNNFGNEIKLGGGLNIAAGRNALGNGRNTACVTEDTIVFTNAVDGSEMTVKTPLRLASSLSPTNAIVVKTDSDVVFEDFAVSSGALIKRGKGRMTIVSSQEKPITYGGGYGVGTDANYNISDSSEAIVFAPDGTAPAVESHQYTGFNVAEGELVVRGTPESPTVRLQTALLVGPEVAGSPDGYAQPMLTVDGAKLSHGGGSGHWAVGHHVAKAGNAVTSPTLRIVNGGEVSCGNLRVGQNSNHSPGAFSTVAVTNGTVKAVNAFRFYTAGNTIAKAGVLLRFKDSTCVVSGTGGSNHGIILSGNIDADFDNTVFGASNEKGIVDIPNAASGELRFRNGSIFAVDRLKQSGTSAGSKVVFAFDNAEWQWGGGDYVLQYDKSTDAINAQVGGAMLRYGGNRRIEMRGTGVILKPVEGATFATEVKFEGEGGMVCDGAGTVKFKADALAFSGLLDIRQGTVDLSESAALPALSVKGPGTLKGGSVAVLTIRPQWSGEELAGAPVLDGVSAGRVVVDFAAGEPMTLDRFEKVRVATFRGDVSKWKVAGTGHSHPIAVFESVGDGEVMLTLRERKPLKIIVR